MATALKPWLRSIAGIGTALLGCAMANAHGASTLRSITVYEKADVPDVIRIRSSAFEPGATLPNEHTAAGEGRSPPLAWSGIPPTAQSILLLVEDPDAHGSTPYVHWLAYDLPADTESLPSGIPNAKQFDAIAGAKQGKNSAGTVGYTPPHPPRQDAPHEYHFEIFALNAMLNLAPAMTREQVMAAAMRHVVAKGEIIGTYGAR